MEIVKISQIYTFTQTESIINDIENVKRQWAVK